MKWSLKIWSVALAVGIAGGAIGAFLAVQFNAQRATAPAPLSTAVFKREAVREAASMPQVSRAAQSIVRFIKPVQNAQLMSPEDTAALGIALTADGLMVSTVPLRSTAGLRAISFEGGPFAFEFAKDKKGTKAVLAENLTLFKASDKNEHPKLQPVELARFEDFALGERLFAINSANEIALHYITALGEYANLDEPSLSEEAGDILRIDGALAPGTLLFEESGLLAGIAAQGGRIIVAEQVGMALNKYLKDGFYTTTQLGVRALDLSRLLPLDKTIPRAGLLLKSIKGRPAVIAGSPAARAGLKDGDIITSFDGKRLDGRIPFALILARYQAGAEVEVGILRAGKEDKVKVVLGSK